MASHTVAPLQDNPSGSEFDSLKDDGRRFVVLHMGVGTHKKGAIISAKDLGPGAQLARLCNPDAFLGQEAALRELTRSEIEALDDALSLPVDDLPAVSRSAHIPLPAMGRPSHLPAS